MGAKNARLKRECAGKQHHATEQEARSHLSSLRRKDGGGGRGVYKCPYCGTWHVGKPPARVRQSIAAKRRNRNA